MDRLVRPWPLLMLVAAGCAQPPSTNVLLITVDTLRADRLGCYGYSLAHTPVIDGVAADGVKCTDVTSASPITLPSHATIFTGLYPPAHGVRDNGYSSLGDDAVTLAERLRRAGYEGCAVVSADVLNRRYGLAQGFDHYDDALWTEDDPGPFKVRTRRAPRSAGRAVAWLEERQQRGSRRPFLLWLHFFDPHAPYAAPAEDQRLAASPYDAEITAVDRAVGEVLECLQGQEELADTLVLLTADHGESLGEHQEQTHGIFVYDATVRVPLVVRWPGRVSAGGEYTAPVRTVDIMPTVLGALGLDVTADVQGVDLWPALTGQVEPPRLAQYCEALMPELGFGMAPLVGLRADGFKWIRAPRPEVYDLQVDPHELDNRFKGMTDTALALDQQLQGILDDCRQRALSARRVEVDGTTEEMLVTLGYLAPEADRRAMAGMDPKDGIVVYNWLSAARDLFEAERWSEARVLLRKVLDVTPRNVEARNTLAATLMHLGDVDGARRHYLRSVADEPRQPWARNALGMIELKQGHVDLAEEHMLMALEVAPGYVEAMVNLGLVATLRGDARAAKRWYRRVLEADPEFAKQHRWLENPPAP